MFDCDLTQISIVKYLQNYLYFWIFVNLKLKFACVKLSLRVFLDALYDNVKNVTEGRRREGDQARFFLCGLISFHRNFVLCCNRVQW